MSVRRYGIFQLCQLELITESEISHVQQTMYYFAYYINTLLTTCWLYSRTFQKENVVPFIRGTK